MIDDNRARIARSNLTQSKCNFSPRNIDEGRRRLGRKPHIHTFCACQIRELRISNRLTLIDRTTTTTAVLRYNLENSFDNGMHTSRWQPDLGSMLNFIYQNRLTHAHTNGLIERTLKLRVRPCTDEVINVL